MAQVKGKFLREWRQRQLDKGEQRVEDLNEKSHQRQQEYEQKKEQLRADKTTAKADTKAAFQATQTQSAEQTNESWEDKEGNLLLRLLAAVVAGIVAFPLIFFVLSIPFALLLSYTGLGNTLLVIPHIGAAIIAVFAFPLTIIVVRKVDRLVKRLLQGSKKPERRRAGF